MEDRNGGSTYRLLRIRSGIAVLACALGAAMVLGGVRINLAAVRVPDVDEIRESADLWSVDAFPLDQPSEVSVTFRYNAQFGEMLHVEVASSPPTEVAVAFSFLAIDQEISTPDRGVHPVEQIDTGLGDVSNVNRPVDIASYKSCIEFRGRTCVDGTWSVIVLFPAGGSGSSELLGTFGVRDIYSLRMNRPLVARGGEEIVAVWPRVSVGSTELDRLRYSLELAPDSVEAQPPVAPGQVSSAELASRIEWPDVGSSATVEIAAGISDYLGNAFVGAAEERGVTELRAANRYSYTVSSGEDPLLNQSDPAEASFRTNEGRARRDLVLSGLLLGLGGSALVAGFLLLVETGFEIRLSGAARRQVRQRR